ncbi:hypothetical protein BD626DRAFT_495795 [Schizophyllum amplum]|uniref:Uncharacterized protein n=1 Tax=Schizophyllum amplum TaxID=97359 RepID=A0A550CEF3_9AGAR|nr:hypothetical protein BD626DRAFT_495795 [Auriculariopsis ampla]
MSLLAVTRGRNHKNDRLEGARRRSRCFTRPFLVRRARRQAHVVTMHHGGALIWVLT